jgi:hypothetical protein
VYPHTLDLSSTIVLLIPQKAGEIGQLLMLWKEDAWER